MSETMTRADVLTKAYLSDKNVLFKADTSHGVAWIVGNIMDGSVISVDEMRRTALVCFLAGHQSFTDPVAFDNLLAVADKELGAHVQIGRFRGQFVDLRQ